MRTHAYRVPVAEFAKSFANSATVVPTGSDTDENQRRVRIGLESAVCVIDVDVRLAQPRRDASEFARLVREPDLQNFMLDVREPLAVEHRFGGGSSMMNRVTLVPPIEKE